MNSGNELDNELTKEECIKIIDDLNNHNVQKISFFGGEPLVRKDFFEISNYAFSKGVFISFTTNSLLINDEMINNELYKFEYVRISLDGPTAETHEFIRNKKGLYNITVNNIKKLIKNGIDVGIVTCVSHNNIDYIEEMAVLLDSLGIKKWFLPIMAATGRGSKLKELILTPKEVEHLLEVLNILTSKVKFDINLDLPYAVLMKDKNEKIKASCPAALTELVIFANGDISPCCEIPVFGGNIRNKSIYEIWNDSQIFNDFRNRNLFKGKCGNCEFLKNCGGCRANAYIKYKDYLGGDDVCWKN